MDEYASLAICIDGKTVKVDLPPKDYDFVRTMLNFVVHRNLKRMEEKLKSSKSLKSESVEAQEIFI